MRVMGPYAVTLASCQPSPRVHVAVTMWSVNVVPNPGFASTASRSASGRGSVRRVTSKVSGAAVWLMGVLLRRCGFSCRGYLPRVARRAGDAGAARVLEPGGDRVADLGGAAYGRAPLGEVRGHGGLDPGGLLGAAQVL